MQVAPVLLIAKKKPSRFKGIFGYFWCIPKFYLFIYLFIYLFHLVLRFFIWGKPVYRERDYKLARFGNSNVQNQVRSTGNESPIPVWNKNFAKCCQTGEDVNNKAESKYLNEFSHLNCKHQLSPIEPPPIAHSQTDTCQKALPSGRPNALVSATKKDENNS